MDSMDEIRQIFFIECEDLLSELEEGLTSINDGEADGETINAVFRAAHSIKGGAGAFALTDLVRFAHKFETTLDEVRQDRLEATGALINTFLRAGDLLADLVRAARDEDTVDAQTIDALIAELEAYISSADEAEHTEEADDSSDDSFKPVLLDFGLDLPIADEAGGDDQPKPTQYSIRFRPAAALYANGNESGLLLRALSDLGEISVECDYSAVPALEEINPEGAYLEWKVVLSTNSDEAEILEVFDFVDGHCELEVVRTETSTPLSPLETEIEADSIADEIIPVVISETACTENAGDDEKVEPDAAPGDLRKQQNQAEKKPAGPKAVIRVDLERVDRLINLVGELVINQAMVSQCVEDAGLTANSAVGTGLEEFNQLTRNIQESVMSIRAQPVKSLFQRMSRIVREAAAATGKNVRLITDGEGTEVDKTVVERLADPLTHMIRNAVDHGLESPEKRAANGKPEEGVIHLTAAHRSGRVVIEIVDDGGGINRDKVKQIATEKNLIPTDAILSDSEIDNLLFLPGFSTANEVSNLSGRGVGMDVVKRAIQSLGGRISINSTPGKGSTFSISLPLTLAVLDGMVVSIAGQTYVAPLSAIIETFKLESQEVHTVADGSRVVSVRGAYVPIIDVGSILGFQGASASEGNKVILLVENANGVRAALIVDAIQDQRQVVIKGLEDNYGHVRDIAAATILGDGRIALILDTDALITSSAITTLTPETDFALAG